MNDSVDVCSGAVPGPQRHLQGVEGQLGRHRRGSAPADDAPGEHVGDEGREGHARPGRDVGEVDHPQLVRPLRPEVAVDEIGGPGGGGVGTGGADPDISAGADEALGTDETLDGAASDLDALASQLGPHLAGAVETPTPPAVLEHPADLDDQLGVTDSPRRRRPGPGGVVGARGDVQTVLAEHPAHRLDPEPCSVFVNERDHHGCRGSSSRAKNEDAAKRISLARLSSRTSRSSSLIREAS
jgi:hypothetical protein